MSAHLPVAATRVGAIMSVAAATLWLALGSCSHPRAEEGDGTQDRNAVRDSAGVVVKQVNHADSSYLTVSVRHDGRVVELYRSGNLGGAVALVRLLPGDEAYPWVLWSVDDENFVGSVLVRVRGDTAYSIYRALAPDRGVCSPTTSDFVDGQQLLVEHRAGVYPAEACVDPAEDCVWQFPTTWPVLLAIHGDSLVDVSGEHPVFYRDRAGLYALWADSIARGARARGQEIQGDSSIAHYCGRWVVDSLRALAGRASRLSERRAY